MSIRFLVLAAVVGIAAACASTTGPRPAKIEDVASAYDWQNEPGAKLNTAYRADMMRLLKGVSPASATAALKAAQYECEVGDATVCKRGFATRACQMDWDVRFATNSAAISAVDAGYRRDCVGVKGDWPTEVRSAIDDQLAGPPKNLP